jgi:hypothetical protein
VRRAAHSRKPRESAALLGSEAWYRLHSGELLLALRPITSPVDLLVALDGRGLRLVKSIRHPTIMRWHRHSLEEPAPFIFP